MTDEKGFDYPDAQTLRSAQKEDAFAFQLYSAIVRRLRAPDGCPWDRKQSLGSLRRHLIEETFETVSAIDMLIQKHGDPRTAEVPPSQAETTVNENGPLPNRDDAPTGTNDVDNAVAFVKEELGDMLLVAFLAAGVLDENFGVSMADVVRENGLKLIRRHPHVFGDVAVSGVDEVVTNWSRIKRDVEGKTEDFHHVGSELPPLLRAAKIQKRAAKHGFDWPDAVPAVEKIREEADELLSDIAEKQTDGQIESEIGDLLFSVVNVSRKLGLDPAVALNRTNMKFAHRLQYIQETLAAQGRSMDNSTLEEMDALWERSKRTS